jgi:hypothetical protein
VIALVVQFLEELSIGDVDATAARIENLTDVFGTTCAQYRREIFDLVRHNANQMGIAVDFMPDAQPPAPEAP